MNPNNIKIQKLIYEAFLNEYALEKQLKKKFSIEQDFLNFKVTQMSTFFKVPNLFYFFSIFFLCLIFTLYQFILGIFALFFFFLRFVIPKNLPKNLMIRTADKRLVSRSISQLNLDIDEFIDFRNLNLIFFVKKNRLFNYLFFYLNFILLCLKSDIFVILLLNFKDLFKLYLLTVYLLDNPGISVISDCHYQRYAYLLSKLKENNLIVVQHGYIDDTISFIFPFGKIGLLMILDFEFLNKFKSYYQIENWILIDRISVNIKYDKGLENTCFLASSSPYIDHEIEFAKLFKEHFNIKLIVKKHPKHVYSAKKLNELFKFVDEEWLDQVNYPCSKIFVSYSSYLKFDYKFIGSFTFDISDFKSPECMFKDVFFIKSIQNLEIKRF